MCFLLCCLGFPGSPSRIRLRKPLDCSAGARLHNFDYVNVAEQHVVITLIMTTLGPDSALSQELPGGCPHGASRTERSFPAGFRGGPEARSKTRYGSREGPQIAALPSQGSPGGPGRARRGPTSHGRGALTRPVNGPLRRHGRGFLSARCHAYGGRSRTWCAPISGSGVLSRAALSQHDPGQCESTERKP